MRLKSAMKWNSLSNAEVRKNSDSLFRIDSCFSYSTCHVSQIIINGNNIHKYGMKDTWPDQNHSEWVTLMLMCC